VARCDEVESGIGSTPGGRVPVTLGERLALGAFAEGRADRPPVPELGRGFVVFVPATDPTARAALTRRIPSTLSAVPRKRARICVLR
jgi:hypothetical protein